MSENPRIARGVSLRPVATPVRFAIDFNGQLFVGAKEIEDERTPPDAGGEI